MCEQKFPHVKFICSRGYRKSPSFLIPSVTVSLSRCTRPASPPFLPPLGCWRAPPTAHPSLCSFPTCTGYPSHRGWAHPGPSLPPAAPDPECKPHLSPLARDEEPGTALDCFSPSQPSILSHAPLIIAPNHQVPPALNPLCGRACALWLPQRRGEPAPGWHGTPITWSLMSHPLERDPWERHGLSCSVWGCLPRAQNTACPQTCP